MGGCLKPASGKVTPEFTAIGIDQPVESRPKSSAGSQVKANFRAVADGHAHGSAGQKAHVGGSSGSNSRTIAGVESEGADQETGASCICGNPVMHNGLFCGSCGAKQSVQAVEPSAEKIVPAAPAPSPAGSTSALGMLGTGDNHVSQTGEEIDGQLVLTADAGALASIPKTPFGIAGVTNSEVTPEPKEPASTIEDVAPGNFGIELRRSATSERWGFVWDSQAIDKKSVRIVEKVSANSVLAEWNSAHPGHDVRAGDTLVKVNGIGGRLETLTLELSRQNHIICEFKPCEPRLTAEALVKKDSSVKHRNRRVETPDLSTQAGTPSCSGRASPEEDLAMQRAGSSRPGSASTSLESKAGLPPVVLGSAGQMQQLPQGRPQSADAPLAAPHQSNKREPSAKHLERTSNSIGDGTGIAVAGIFPDATAAGAAGNAEKALVPLDSADASEEPGLIRMELTREGTAAKWGLIWDSQAMEKKGIRVLEKVAQNSLAAEWCAANPGKEVQRGDELVKVNGQAGRLEVLTMELSRSLKVVCEFRRPTSGHGFTH